MIYAQFVKVRALLMLLFVAALVSAVGCDSNGSKDAETCEERLECDPMVSCVDNECAPCPDGFVGFFGCRPMTGALTEKFTLEDGDDLLIYRNFPLDTPRKFQRLILVFHGTGRSGEKYFDVMWDSATENDAQGSSLIIAPEFRIKSDEYAEGFAVWSRNGWYYGYNSESGTSSYAAIDQLVRSSLAHHPEIKDVFIVGHSAGGQIAHRYALLSPTEDQFPSKNFTYLATNGGVFAYLNPKRPGVGRPKKEDCPYYDRWRFGLQTLPLYGDNLNLTRESISKRYASRDVYYFIGARDTSRRKLAQSCSADLQGRHRRERTENYVKHLEEHYGKPTHQLVKLRGIGHSSKALESEEMRNILFGNGPN